MKWQHFAENDTKEGVDGRWKYLSHDHLVIYIHGSNHPTDWKNNFRLRRFNLGNNIRVIRHDFLESQWVMEYFETIITKNLKYITIGGHSRGGAVAQILSYLIQKRHEDITLRCILFSSKRTGNLNFVRSISEYTSHYKNRGDFVPALPPFPPFYSNVKTQRIGEFTLRFWDAHEPRSYFDIMTTYGLR
jgi:predicted lipase